MSLNNSRSKPLKLIMITQFKSSFADSILHYELTGSQDSVSQQIQILNSGKKNIESIETSKDLKFEEQLCLTFLIQ